MLSYTYAYGAKNFTLEEWTAISFAQGGVVEVEEEGDNDDKVKVYTCFSLENRKPMKVKGLDMIHSDEISEEGIVCTPEPSSIFGLITLGSILAGAKTLQKTKKIN